MALTRLGLNQSINLASNVTGTLATGNGGTGATSFSPGKVGQVINAQQGYFQTNSTSFTDTGLTASITPSATSSKVLVVVSLSGCSSTDQADTSLEARLLRDSSEIIVFETIGGYTASSSYTGFGATSCSYLDSPNSTSALAFKVQISTATSGNVNIGNWQNGSDRAKSTITLMEILA
jgi:hypothetical protein|tara:strand:+ start:108 stop:641 length:534 start_codon:yes stop_codon:yes gene_type:complete